MVTQLSNDEIKSLMKKKTLVNLREIQSDVFVETLTSLAGQFVSEFSAELEKYTGQTNIKVQLRDVRVGNPELYNELSYEEYIHIDSRDRFNIERKLHTFMPRAILEVMHRAKNTSSNVDYNKVATKFINLVNNAFQIYSTIDLPLFEVNEYKEINEVQSHLANEVYQEIKIDFSINGQVYPVVQLLTVNIVQDIYEKQNVKEKKSNSNYDSQIKTVSSFEESGIEFLYNVPLELSVVLGSTKMTVKDVLALSMGQVVELDRLVDAPLDIFVNNQLVAKGEVVVVDDNFGIKVTELKSVEKDKLF